MIRYALRCDDGHAFEAWFRDSVAFDDLAAAGQLSCAICGSSKVAKSLMAPAVGGERAEQDGDDSKPSPGAHVLANDERANALAEAVRRLRRHVAENAEYVGNRFPEEARRIHHEEAERRDIYGEAGVDEARELVEEGIEIFSLPRLPDDQN